MDTVVLFDADGVDTQVLLATLQAGVPAIRAVEERWSALWLVKRWEHQREHSRLLGPGGFSLSIEPGLVSLYHITRFSLFTHDAGAQALLMDACQALASLMGASRMLFTHELMPTLGPSLEEVMAHLRQEIGPPAETLEQLREAQPYAAHAWWLLECD